VKRKAHQNCSMTSRLAPGMSRGSLSPRITPRGSWPGHGQSSARPAVEQATVRVPSPTQVRAHSPNPASRPRSPVVVPDVRITSPRITPRKVDGGQHPHGVDKAHPPEKHQSDYQLEGRLSCLEALVRKKVWDLEDIGSKLFNLESSLQTQSQAPGNEAVRVSYFEDIQRKLKTIDDLDTRLSVLEAKTRVTEQSPDHDQACLSNSQTRMELAKHNSEQIHTQMGCMLSELQKVSRSLCETKSQVTNLESDFHINARTVKWMQCKVFDLSRHMSQMGCYIEEAQEKHVLTQQNVTKLSKEVAGLRDFQRSLSPVRDMQAGMEMSHSTMSRAPFSNDFACLYDTSLNNAHAALQGLDVMNMEAPQSMDGVVAKAGSFEGEGTGVNQNGLEGSRMPEACEYAMADAPLHEVKQQVGHMSHQFKLPPGRLIQRQKVLGTIPEEKSGQSTKHNASGGLQTT